MLYALKWKLAYLKISGKLNIKYHKSFIEIIYGSPDSIKLDDMVTMLYYCH